MKPLPLALAVVSSALLAGFGAPVSAQAGLSVKFKSGNFKGSYNSGGYRGYGGSAYGAYGAGQGGWHGWKGQRHYGKGYGGYPRRYFPGYYAPYAYWGPTVYSVSYGYPANASYLPPQYQPQSQPVAQTNQETVRDSPGTIVINSENTVIYNNPGASPAVDSQGYTPAASSSRNVVVLDRAAPPSSAPTEPVATVSRQQTATPISYRYAPRY